MSNSAEFDTLLKQARNSFRNKNYRQAQQLFQQALEFDERSVDAHDGLATASCLVGDYDQAIKHFTRITELAPTKATAFVNLGAVYNRTREFDKAVNALRKAVSRDNKSADGFYNLAIAQRGLDRPAMALSAYRECIRINPDMAEAHQNLANLLLEMENFQQAKLHYNKALNIRPDFERARRGLKRTEQAMIRQRKQANPFGRLVDEHAHRARATLKVERVLSEQERAEDRTLVHAFAVEIETLGRACAEQLKDELDVSLASLHRTIAEGPEAQVSLPADHERFLTALRQFEEARRMLKNKVMELRAHEELMNTPPLEQAN
jgi:tetratricopeptide (TPR) repeat protein